MPRDPDYSQYTLHVCSHMRLVAWTEDQGKVGWFHIDKRGFLEVGTQSCQASIHRFDMEWPDDCTNLDHMLYNGRDGRKVSPSDKASYQLDKTRA